MRWILGSVVGALWFTLASAGCGDDGAMVPEDAGGEMDADTRADAGDGEQDAGGGNQDAGSDAGSMDAGGPDGSAPDAGQSDGGSTPTCGMYCDRITDNCTGANAQYEGVSDCMDWCNNSGWEAGSSGEGSGNTIACRTTHAGLASTEGGQSVHCPHAGFSGANVCGTWCEVYCDVVMNNCTGENAQYEDQSACMTECSNMSTQGEPGATSGDTVQCRITHAGFAGTTSDGPSVHCSHAGPSGGGVCVDG